MKKPIDYTLYLVTDRDIATAPLPKAVKEAIEGGCTIVQLREKAVSSYDFYQTALEIKKITDEYQIPLIINDRVDIALAVDADGVHIGQSDLPAAKVRELLGHDKLLGVSAQTLEQALKAQKDGADYLGVGAIYKTGTKTDAILTPLSELKAIRNAVQLPIVAIGGLGKKNIPSLQGSGINGIAVVSAILGEEDITAAAKAIKELSGNLS